MGDDLAASKSFYYYGSSLGGRIDDAERAQYSRRGDRYWLLGCTLLFLGPSLILFSVGLVPLALREGLRSDARPVRR